MVCHAAGESAFAGEELPPRTHAIVLAARDLNHLDSIAKILRMKGVAYVPIFESDVPYNGAFMAIGVVPAPTASIKKYFGGIPLYR